MQSASGVLLGQHMMSGNCTNLLELNISHNRLGDKGAEALLDAISHSQNNILSFAMSDAGTTERLSEKCAACITSNIRVRHLVCSLPFVPGA